MIIEFGRHLLPRLVPRAAFAAEVCKPRVGDYCGPPRAVPDIAKCICQSVECHLQRCDARGDLYSPLSGVQHVCIYTTILQAYGVEGTDVSKVGDTTANPH